MRRFPHFVIASLLGLAGFSFAAHAQQGGRTTENGGKMLRKEGKVSARMLREDERAERIGTVRADGAMNKKPKFIREEDRLDHRKHAHKTFSSKPRKSHSTLGN
jgi:hypothetical protein